MSKKIKIKINNSTIGLSLNEFWYFFYYLKNISDFYEMSENKDKKIMISFPGPPLHLSTNKEQFRNIYSQVRYYASDDRL